MSTNPKSSFEPERVMSPGFRERVYAIVRRVPKGRVTTYGRIAVMLGHPGVARHVGNALAFCEQAAEPLPWHRVVNAKGRISTRSTIQRELLEAEGVQFNDAGVDRLKAVVWSE